MQILNTLAFVALASSATIFPPPESAPTPSLTSTTTWSSSSTWSSTPTSTSTYSRSSSYTHSYTSWKPTETVTVTVTTAVSYCPPPSNNGYTTVAQLSYYCPYAGACQLPNGGGVTTVYQAGPVYYNCNLRVEFVSINIVNVYIAYFFYGGILVSTSTVTTTLTTTATPSTTYSTTSTSTWSSSSSTPTCTPGSFSVVDHSPANYIVSSSHTPVGSTTYYGGDGQSYVSSQCQSECLSAFVCESYEIYEDSTANLWYCNWYSEPITSDWFVAGTNSTMYEASYNRCVAGPL